MPVLNLTDTPLTEVRATWKAVEDFALGSVLLVAALPLIVLIAIGIKLSSRGPVIYAQERVTWNGRRFEMYKFRTMPVDAEARSGPVWSSRAESRATPFGALLRRFSLDELPQLFNVLRGEMSVIGPRPHAVAHDNHYVDLIDDYLGRHRVKPGITGWAQVHGFRGETRSVDDMRRRIELDLEYIDNWSLWTDLRILARTVLVGFVHRNAH